MTDSDVYNKHHIRVRRIVVSDIEGSAYEIYISGAETTLTHAEFRQMVLYLVRHLMEVRP